MPVHRLNLGCAYIDEEYVPVDEAKISILDWGVTRSDATYDVVAVVDGRFFRLDDHVHRFERSVAELRMALPVTRGKVVDILHQCVGRANLRDAYVSMTCTRGRPPPGSRDPRRCINRFYAYAIPYVWIVPDELQATGARLRISDRARIPPISVDPTVKNYHWLDLTLSQMDALDRDDDLAVLTDGFDHITEGHGFNLFAISGGRVRTPSRGVLEGITRDTVLKICAENGLPCEQTALLASDVRGADEVFATSTAGGVMPITVVDGQPVGSGKVGPLTTRIRLTYWEWHEDPRFTVPVRYHGEGASQARLKTRDE